MFLPVFVEDFKRPVYIFAFGEYKSKRAFKITLCKFRASNCARKILMPLTFTCVKLYSPNANIYTGHLSYPFL